MAFYNRKLVEAFKFCPLCTKPLVRNPKYNKAGAKSCPEHGDFFIGRGAGREPIVIFKKLSTRVHRPRWNAGKPYAKIKCNETGEVFKNQTEIVKKMGLPKGNLSAHILGKADAKQIHGYTFSVIDVWEE